MINKFLLIGGGLTLAGAGTGAGVGIYYANKVSGQSESHRETHQKPQKPGVGDGGHVQPEAAQTREEPASPALTS